MGSGRFLKYINILIAAVVLVAGASVYWFLYRPLPVRAGTLAAPVRHPVAVHWEERGIPAVRGATEEDVWFAQGFVTAQERMWQMDALRRAAAGELAEIAGAGALEQDREARLLRLRRLAEAAVNELQPEERRALAAYARGVNHYLRTHAGRLPVEFLLAGYRPRPWRMADSAVIGYQMARTLTNHWQADLRKGRLLQQGKPELVEALFPQAGGGGMNPGSNAWAVSGQWTASGRPLLACDMHLEISIPNLWFLARLEVTGDRPLRVAGITFPGLPGVVVGHNERIAWGITNLEFDVQDLYREKIDPATGRYQYQDRIEQAYGERELILVKNGRPFEFVTWLTRHGPVLTADRGAPYSLRWGAAEPRFFRYVFPVLNRARNWEEFRAALAQMNGPAFNFVYADVDGNIGYQVAGRLPIRPGFSGSAPLDGLSGKFEWEGKIPFEQLPSLYNPPGGVIVSANQNPFPAGFPYQVDGNFAAPYRARQIHALLTGRKQWRAEEMLAVQKDVYSEFARFLARQIVEAADRRRAAPPPVQSAVELLRAWDGQMEIERPEPLIATLTYQHFQRALTDAAAPGHQVEPLVAEQVVEHLLRTRPRGFFADWDQALFDEFLSALDEGQRMQGRDVRKWSYGRYNQRLIAHPVGHRLPWISQYWDLGVIRFSGSHTTVKQIHNRIMPSMRMVADLGDWERSLINLPIGQSGHVLSAHYKDQWQAYYAGRSFPMRFGQTPEGKRLLLAPSSDAR